ncbi:MAG: hypothetical protein QM811_16445 [Pirellulales bacterium]
MLPERQATQPVLTVDLLEQGIAALETLGYQIRVETELGRSMTCVIKGRPWLVLDPNQAPREQLEIVLEALRQEQRRMHVTFPSELTRALDFGRKAA